MSSGPAKRQSWKQTKQSSRKQGSSRPARWLLTLLAIGLLVIWFPKAWELFRNRTPPTQVIGMRSGQSRAGVPSLSHGANDLQPMTEIDWPYFAFKDQSTLLQSNQSLSALNSAEIDETGVIIIYVNAHGVTNITADGAADVLCRDYDLAAPQHGVFEVAEWLKQLKDSTAVTKLLVFDSGTIVSDPRLGMLVNDFPRRVIELVEQWDDPHLWVMLSNATFQTPLIGGACDQSLFGTAFVEGLLGNADLQERGGNKDNDVTLDELYRYVVARCNKISAGLQKPLLLRAGTPTSALLEVPDLPLLAISVADSAEEQAASEEAEPISGAAETKGPDDSLPNKPQLAGDAPDSSAAPSQDSSPATTALAGEATGQGSDDALQDPLIQAWRLRDEIESISVSQGWVPQEYAPHLWRQLLDFLVEFDPRRRSANELSDESLRDQLEGLQALQAFLRNPNQTGRVDRGGLVVDDLLRASKSFLASNSRREFETNAQKLREVADAVREVRRISFLMPYFVRWHADTGLVGVGDDTVAGRIEPLLSKIIEFQRDYDRLRGKRLPAFVDIAKRQRDITLDYADLARYLRQHISDVCEPQESTELKARALLQARALLAGPLPTANERAKLTSVVVSFDFSDEPSIDQVRRVVLPQLDDIDRRIDLEEQLQLEQSIVSLHDRRWTTLPLKQDVGGAVNNLAEMGTKLREFYRTTASELADPARHDPMRLLVVDGRDAQRIGWRDELAIRLDIDPPDIKPLLTITSNTSLLELSVDKPLILKARVSSDRNSTIQGRITFSFDPRIDFRPLQGTSFRLDQPNEFTFRVVAKPGYGQLRQKIRPIVMKASLEGFVDGGHEIETWLAGPDRVDLVVTQANQLQEIPGKKGVLLRTFPSRETPFRFAVRNPSNVEKTVIASLYQVPLSLARSVASGRIFNRQGNVLTTVEQATLEGGRPVGGLKLIAASKPLTLPPGAEAEPLDFSAPPPPPTAGADERNDTAKPAPEVKAAGNLDVSQGILCEVSEQKPGGETWLNWIELRTVPPRDYLRTVVRYDLEKLSIKCSLQPGLQIPELAEKPIPIDWDLSHVSSDISDAMGNVINTDSIKSEIDPAELIQAELRPIEGGIARVRMHVDNYPRALAFDVKLDRADVYSVPRRDLSDVRLISVGMVGQPKKYVTSSVFQPNEPDEKNPVVVLQYRDGQRDKAAFPAAQRGSQLELSLQVDAPVIAFGRDSRDTMALRIDTPGFDPIIRYGDRESRFEVAKTGADGLVSIYNPVTDHVQKIDLPAVKGTYELVAELKTSDDYRSASVLLAFDDAPPRLLNFQMPSRIQVGSTLPLSLIADDESGLQTVEYGIVDEPSATPQKLTPIPIPLRNPIRLQTKGLEADQRYYLILRFVDRAGNELVTNGKRGAPRSLPFSLFKPLPVGGPAGGVQPGTVKGKVALRAFGPPRITVELTGGKQFPPVETKIGGSFEFKDVPAGDYVVKASGNPLNRGIHVGEAQISISKQEDFAQSVTINLEPKKD